MTHGALYTRLLQAGSLSIEDDFDAQVLAAMVAVAASEVDSGGTLSDGLGLSGEALRSMIATYLPKAADLLEPVCLDSPTPIRDEEQSLRRLLLRSRSTPAPLSSVFSIIIARRATRPNHLWQDLGLASRGDLSKLMQRHFAPLALRNHQDMKWKKFFYRLICQEEDSPMCLAPCCSDCSDFDGCFGEESGDSLLARTRVPLSESAQTEGRALNGS